jgi:hypothetical protein
MTNIIKFPGVSELPLNQEEMVERLTSTREQFADLVATECYESIMSIAQSYGIMSNLNKVNASDTVAIYEILRSSFMRYSGIHHPFQEVVDQIITEVDETEMRELTGEEPVDQGTEMGI